MREIALMQIHLMRIVALAAMVIACPSIATATVPSDRAGLPNYDQRAGRKPAGEAASVEQQAGARRLRMLLPGVRVDFDPVTGAPRRVAAVGTALSGGNSTGKAVSAATAGAIPAGDPHRATKAFLKEHSGLFGHGPEALDQARVTRDYTTPHNGLKTVAWEQQADGIPVFEGALISHTTRQGELVNICSQFIPDPVKAAVRGVSAGSASPAAPSVTARQAVTLAARNVGQELTDAKLSANGGPAAGAEQRQEFTSPGLKGRAEAKLTWLPLDRQTLRLCWDVVFMGRTRGEMYRTLVDASTGEVLLRRCLTSYLTEASYRVFTSDSPSPFSPGHPTPATTQPPLASRTLVTLSALDTNASPAGWIDDGGNETQGNNVDAHTDHNGDDTPDLPRPQGSPFRVFDFPMDPGSQDPTNYANAAVVQLFYLNNWMHDRLYQLGFTEAAGNFQSNNFSRGGLGNDAVQADAQDGSGTDNANFSTPPDGSPGRMQMFIFKQPNPHRDGDLDAEVVLHEYTHGLSWRLVGGGQALGDTQSDGMGEGWSDFYALTLLSEAGDDVNGIYPVGAYASYQIGGAGDTQNYYFGIRRYPCTTDMAKNPLTFKDIDPAQADYCSSSAPYHTGMFGSCSSARASEVHSEGEVWCVTLWDARARLVNKYGWETGNQLILQLVTDGMRLTPAHPDFLQARDAILQADLVDTGGANQWDLWTAFARRGMGFSAVSPASSTTTDILESFDLPDDLRITPLSGFVASGPVGGPFTSRTLTLVLSNAGSNTLTWAAGSSNAWLNIAPASGTLDPGGPATPVVESVGESAASLPMGIYTTTAQFTNLDNSAVQNRRFILRVGQPDYYTGIFAANVTNLAYQSFTFTPDSSPSFYSACRQPATRFFTDPAGGTPLALGDDNYAAIAISGGNSAAIYGTRSSLLYVGSNGYLTMNAGDSYMVESALTHFDLPRVSALFHDLNPASGGTVSWKQLSDRAAVTWQAVPVYGAAAQTNSFQIELFFDGRIRITYLSINAPGGLAGLSAGTGVPAYFMASDFSDFGSCAPLGIELPSSAAETSGVLTNAGAVWISSPAPTNLTVALSSSDPGRLAVPAATTIPAGELYGSFDLALVDNSIHDGDLAVLVTGSADGFTNISAAILVIDDDTPPQITSQPASQVTLASNSVSFSVKATGKDPLYYFWSRNGHIIAGATGLSYATNNVQVADSGSVFTCIVSNTFGTALSSNAVLTVLASRPNYSTEWFDVSPHTNDLAGRMFTFTPDASPGRYAVCRQAASSFPTDPAGGTVVSLSDDSSVAVTLSGTNSVSIYNRRTNVFFIGSNGYLTMDSSDLHYTPSYTNHFSLPRVSALFCDLNPANQGSISWKELGDRVAVTYQGVPEYGHTNGNSFQAELFYDGRIRVSYLELAVPLALAGLSAGQGLPILFAPSDLSASDPCVVLSDPDIATQPQSQSVAAGASASFSVTAVGTPLLSYQWFKEGVALVDGGNIAGAQTPTLMLASVQAADMGSYSVTVSNLNGRITSAKVTLVGPFAPVILTQPAGRQAAAGSTVTFTLGAAGPGPLGFQWQQGGTNLADGGKIGGSRTASLLISNVQLAEMANYSVVVSNANGSTTSSNAPLTLWPLVSWGHNGYGQADLPSGLTNVAAVAAGHYHSLALKNNGTVAAWGAGTSYAGTSPHFGQSAVPATLSNVTSVAAGYYHSLALRADGTVAAWGASSNSPGTSPNYGQALVPGLLSNVTAVAGGAYHSLALKSDRTVTGWGAGTSNTGANPHYGQSHPPAGLSNVVAIAAGGFHSLALMSDGTVLTWGAGTNNTGASPHYGQAQVPAGLSNVVAISAGAYHTLALRADGTVLGWGAGIVNKDANPDYGQSLVPVGLSNVVAIAAGAYHSLAVIADGTMVAWGANTYGQTHVPNGLSNVISLAVRGGYHVMALEGDGRPHFTVQPVSQAMPGRPTLAFTAMAVGQQALGYQWQFNGTNLTDSATMSGSHSSMLTLTEALAGSYRAIATNALGSATSAVATLAGPLVVPPPLLRLPAWSQSNGILSFAWSAVSGQNYQVQYKQDLMESNWLNLGSPFTATNDAASAPDTATNAQRFYRVILVP